MDNNPNFGQPLASAPPFEISKLKAETDTASTISGLTPGTTYVLQACAVTNTGYTDWSDSVTRIAL